MKNELKMGIACGTILIAGFAAQIGATYQQTEKIVHQMNAQTQTMNRQLNAERAMQKVALKHQIQALEAATFEDDNVTEEFKITDTNDNGFVRGELTEGTGEGIYYPMEAFVVEGAGTVKVGDIVQVTWSQYAYQNENWDDIVKMEKIIE